MSVAKDGAGVDSRRRRTWHREGWRWASVRRLEQASRLADSVGDAGVGTEMVRGWPGLARLGILPLKEQLSSFKLLPTGD